MAKPKKGAKPQDDGEEEIVEKESIALKNIRKKFGDGVTVSGDDIVERPIEIITVSPALDIALGGGVKMGSMVVLGGPYRSGKTTLALHIGGECQRQGKKVIFVDAEMRLGSRELRAVNGLDPKKVIVIQSCKGQILSAEDLLFIVEEFLTNDTDCCIIIDSISVLSESKEMTNDLGQVIRGGSAKLMSQFCRRATPLIPVNNHLVIGLAQVYANVSGMGKTNIVKISNSVNHLLSTFIEATHTKRWNIGADENSQQIGQETYWTVQRSPLPGGLPNQKATSYLRYGEGVDEHMEVIKLGEELSLIEKGGAWYTLSFLEDTPKMQGVEKVREYIKETPGAFQILKDSIKEMTTDE